jgi:hypothetical protein
VTSPAVSIVNPVVSVDALAVRYVLRRPVLLAILGLWGRIAVALAALFDGLAKANAGQERAAEHLRALLEIVEGAQMSSLRGE